jgi:hypothetical protein
MHSAKTYKIHFILCLILFAAHIIDAVCGPVLTKSRNKRLVLSNAPTPSAFNQEISSDTTTLLPEKQSDEKKKTCNSNAAPNITITIKINVNDTENTTKTLNDIGEKSYLLKHDNLEGFADDNRIKKDTPVTLGITAQSAKILKKKETGHGKIFLLSSIISNGNVINGNLDTNNYDHNNNKRNTKDETNHGWKYRKPIKFQKITKPSLGVAVNNQDSNKMIYEIYNKNPGHIGDAHDNKKLMPILPSRFVTVNSNLLIDYLFPSMFKNMFSQLNREYLPSSQNSLFNEIGYSDKLLDGWFNLKDENTAPLKCTCSRLRKLDEMDVNSKM